MSERDIIVVAVVAAIVLFVVWFVIDDNRQAKRPRYCVQCGALMERNAETIVWYDSRTGERRESKQSRCTKDPTHLNR